MDLIQYLEKAGPQGQPMLQRAYDEFLAEYPLCYGYWHKLAKLHQTLSGDDAAIAVYERGIAAINCIELYMHYCTLVSGIAGPTYQERHVMAGPNMPMGDDAPSDGEARARAVFERAIADQGCHWLSETLWNTYISFEEGRGGSLMDARLAYIQLRAALQPTACAFQFIATFRSHLEKATYAGEGVLLGPTNPFRGSDTIDMAVLALPEEERAAIQALGKDVQARKVALLDAAQRLHTQTLSEVSHRRRFEDQISRRYFHVEKLHKQQLATWHDYLDASIHNAETAEAGLGGGEVPPVAVARVYVRQIFERCLVPCALYAQFWQRYASYLESQGDVEAAREVLRRGARTAFKRRPDLDLHLALIEESQNQPGEARAIYAALLGGEVGGGSRRWCCGRRTSSSGQTRAGAPPWTSTGRRLRGCSRRGTRGRRRARSWAGTLPTCWCGCRGRWPKRAR